MSILSYPATPKPLISAEWQEEYGDIHSSFGENPGGRTFTNSLRRFPLRTFPFPYLASNADRNTMRAFIASARRQGNRFWTFWPGSLACYDQFVGVAGPWPLTGCMVYDASAVTYTDETDDANSATANDVSVHPTAGVSDELILLFNHRFPSLVNVTIGTSGTGTYTISGWKYYKNDGTWATITVTDTDTMTNFKAAPGVYRLTLTPPTDADTVTVNNASGYALKAIFDAGTVTIAPLVTLITVNSLVFDLPGSGLAEGTTSIYINQIPKVVTGSVTQANMKISAVDGTSFVDFTAASILTGNLNKYLVVTDSVGKQIKGWIKAAGTGGTLGSELVTNGGMETGNPPTSWSATETPETFERSAVQKHSGTYSARVVESTGSYGGFCQPISKVAGRLYEASFWYYLVSGAMIGSIQNGYGNDNLSAVYPSTIGSWTEIHYTATEILTGAIGDIRFQAFPNAEFYIDDVSTKQVLTPSTTGVTIVSTFGGTTYNWTSKETGFNYNDSAGYTCQIFDSSDSLKTLNKIVDGTGTAVPTTPLAPTIGITYKVVVKCSTFSVGSCAYTFGGVTGSSLAAATTYTDYITCTSTANLTFTPTNTSRFTIVLVTVSPVKRVVTDRKSVKWGNNTFHSFGCSLVTNNENVGYEPLALGVWQKVIHEDMLP